MIELNLTQEQKEELYQEFKVRYALEERKDKSSKAKTWEMKEVLQLSYKHRLRVLLETITNNPDKDRHELLSIIKVIDETYTQSTLSGRLGDLLNNKIVIESGTHLGRYGKIVSKYQVKGI